MSFFSSKGQNINYVLPSTLPFAYLNSSSVKYATYSSTLTGYGDNATPYYSEGNTTFHREASYIFITGGLPTSSSNNNAYALYYKVTK
jgi:hypothetical protein